MSTSIQTQEPDSQPLTPRWTGNALRLRFGRFSWRLAKTRIAMGCVKTPQRVARMYEEMFEGLRKDPVSVLKKTFVEKYDEMVLVKDITFESVCEHHLLPFFGKAHIAYLPNGKIVGLSKLARVVEILSRRPQVQERMTEHLADLVMNELEARGVGVVLEASHTCMSIRGIRKPGSMCTTSAMRGSFRTNLSTRAELMALINSGK